MQKVISLWPNDAIWKPRSGLILAQLIACCLKASSHYLNQCWLIIKGVLWHSSESNIPRNGLRLYLLHVFEYSTCITLLKLLHLPGVSELTHWGVWPILLQNGCHFPDNIFKCIFLNENVWISIKILLKFVPKGPINNMAALVQIMARWQAIIWINDG